MKIHWDFCKVSVLHGNFNKKKIFSIIKELKSILSAIAINLKNTSILAKIKHL